MNYFELIKNRRSVRTFKESIYEEDLNRILEFAKNVSNPYDIKIRWQIIDNKKLKLNVPVITGTDIYIAGVMPKVTHCEEAFGYTFEQVVLYAGSLGIGTTWIAGTMNREGFEKAVDLKEDEVMPCISPLGYPADKMAFREAMMRKGIKADTRKEDKELFFENSFDQPYINDNYKEVLEAIKWAPSAVNKQPWRILIKDNVFNFYERKDKGYGHDGFDIQRIDVGIAMAHFVLTINKEVEFVLNEPEIPLPENTYYIGSYVVK